jgi:CHAT domain-containing protein
LDQEYGKPTAQRNQQLTSNLQNERQKLDDELKEAVDRLNKAFPQYPELSAPDPITIDSVQKLLGSDEALLSVFTLDDRLLVWLVRKDKDFFYRDIEIKKEELKKLVTSVRVSLDQTKNPEFKANGNLVPFDINGAYELYKLLFSPLKEHLTGIKQLIIVPDEVFLPLPFGALITSAESEAYKNLSELSRKGETLPVAHQMLLQYSQLPWLIKDYAITVLPSATSLRALRQIPRTQRKESEQLIAFGDPVLRKRATVRGGAMLASRGTFVPLEEIHELGRLPGTRRELETIAKTLGVSTTNSLFLGQQATEPTVNKLNASGRLAKAEVVAFATHGLISGALDKKLKEPALVLTPPDKPTEEDDGLLGLEDILKLKLDSANWVILSACNTGSADGSGEGLSGLTRAFFFAGARSLLVSHWSVDDRATQNLMTEIFQRYAKDKTIPRAEALRQGMLSIMTNANGRTAYFAHPFSWAPFFVVGDR